jgi:hypothetical protein
MAKTGIDEREWVFKNLGGTIPCLFSIKARKK